MYFLCCRVWDEIYIAYVRVICDGDCGTYFARQSETFFFMAMKLEFHFHNIYSYSLFCFTLDVQWRT